ncbi:MAG: hypothetical protein KGP14_16005, partial [Betaproteobacteria bacterium]|nr:hypothetical protein [Betaproteobacteria bacterium]
GPTMPRRTDGIEDIAFFFRFIVEPFRSHKWALAYIAIGVILLLLDLAFIENPPPANIVGTPFDGLVEAIKAPFRKRVLYPAAGFGAVGTLGLLTCFIRDLIEDAARR